MVCVTIFLCILITLHQTKGSYRIRCGLQFEETADQKESNRPETDTSKRIAAVDDTLQDEFPWIVSLQRQKQNHWYHACGGSIITPNVILTAAHCEKIFDSGSGHFRAVAGCQELDYSDDCQSVSIYPDDFIIHHEYNARKTRNDVAIIRLHDPFNLTNYENNAVGSVCLPMRNHTLYQGMAAVAGYGDRKFFGNDADNTANIMRIIDLNILSATDCKITTVRKNDFDKGFDPDRQICSGFKKGVKDSCKGDSGSPLMVMRGKQIIIIGIVSFGPEEGCGLVDKPGVYTRVAYYLNWIIDKVREST